MPFRTGWRDVLDRWKVEAALLPSCALAQALLLDPNWHAALRDSKAIILVRTLVRTHPAVKNVGCRKTFEIPRCHVGKGLSFAVDTSGPKAVKYRDGLAGCVVSVPCNSSTNRSGCLISDGTDSVRGADRPPRLEIGPQITQTYLPVNPVGSVQYQLPIGGLGAIRIRSWLAMDSSLGITPTIPIEGTSFAGGRLTEGFLGARLGFRFRRVEIYGKIKPAGVVSFGKAILHVESNNSALQFETGRLTEPALDLGGIVMLRISKRLAVRYDVGDTLTARDDQSENQNRNNQTERHK